MSGSSTINGASSAPSPNSKPPKVSSWRTAFSRTRQKPFLWWIYSPSPSSVTFALRSTIAACLSLGIAFWMELDSPAWAPMTVWAVAQTTRGESQSKARWRIIGTIIGAIAAIAFMALAPQAPWMFFPLIAIWIGLCSGFATFVSNFRSYALVLAGYTCSIICMDAASNPNDIFFVAVSRSTYIVLGVLCEALMGFIFATSQERQARAQMRDKLESALILVSRTLKSILGAERGALTAARNQFGTILTINDQIEFAEVEMGPHGHEGDHARAALAAVSILLSRGFGMATRLQLLSHDHPAFEQVAEEILLFLKYFPDRLPLSTEVPDLLAELQHLRDLCRQYAAPHRHDDILTSLEPVPELEPFELASEQGAYAPNLDERVLFVSLGELLGDMELAIVEYEASTHIIRGDHFHFQRQGHRDTREAIHNGIRGACVVMITALIYEVTAWPNGLGFIAITTLVCGLFATKENPVLGTTEFLKGALAAYAMAWLLVFVLMPKVTTYETLFLFLGPAMFLGGLAKGNPATAGGSAAYGLLLPAMLGLHNHSVMNEMAFYNGNMATVLAVCISVMVFRAVLPFSSSAERFRLRRVMLSELRGLAQPSHKPEISAWVGRNTDRFARLIRHAGPTPLPLIEACIQGTLATLTLGLNVIRLRTLMDREYLPESARRPIQLVLQYVEHSTRRHDKAARVANAAVRRLRALDALETDLITRLEMTRAITYLVVIAHTMQTNADFLDADKPFTGEHSQLAKN
ncbi:FUSC family protein [Gluconobacter wancherniae]|uniref:FUSC family protein n=1 Tax=Gluconobacter wancherniae TaxID=1307955 RepID=UPI001B8C225E|nr:FUSC family protein [Gluconobacter wancherniae]MBS1063085.1 FUSC family protein [Gluconobacter wancherniae]MBS1094182.1 FUSC family protein [Gluconobacter wancherniae]